VQPRAHDVRLAPRLPDPLVGDAATSQPSTNTLCAAIYPLEKYRDALVHATQAERAGKVLFAW
jgi:hypothetical protein